MEDPHPGPPADSGVGGEAADGSEDDGAALRDLRALLGVPPPGAVHEIERRVSDRGLRSRDVADVLPDAVAQRALRDDRLARALRPTIEEAFRDSVKRDPRRLVDALTPLMGPAIRRSIASALRGMVQTFNTALEHSLSPRGLRWRLEAMRTGVPFGEVVLLHSLAYRVEQVFLIHRETSLLLLHEVAPTVQAPAPELVSAMLSAISDFVSDAFAESSDGVPDEDPRAGLGEVRVGDRVVLVEGGPRAVLAAVVRGEAPEELRVALQEALESIHVEHGEALESFDGDAAPLEMARAILEPCVQERFVERRRDRGGAPPWLWVAGIALVIGLVWWGMTAFAAAETRQLALDTLRAEPGYVVMNHGRDGRALRIALLVDPVARPLEEVLEAGAVPRERVVAEVTPFASLEPALVLRRARGALAPPPEVSLSLDGDVLVVSGRAPHAFVESVRAAPNTVLGVGGVRDAGLLDLDVEAAQSAIARVAGRSVPFEPGWRVPNSSADDVLSNLRSALADLAAAARALDRPALVDLVGRSADDSALALDRAMAVRAELAALAGPDLRILEDTEVGGPDPDSRGVILRARLQGDEGDG